MASFVNFNNKKEESLNTYSIRTVKEALYLSETKNTNRIEKMISGLEGRVTLSEALNLFSDKLNAMSVLSDINSNALPVYEGQFSWMTYDTDKQIGSEKQNTIDVYMYDNEGNQWFEKKYNGYGEFGGMDYYTLLAKMNGYSEEDLSKRGMEMRDLGIDLAFNKLKTKIKGGKVLFPALVEDPKFNWKRHDFTQEAESDEYQSWYQEPEYDDEDDDYENGWYESVMTEAMSVNEWGSSDQGNFNKSMHKEMGSPKKMPSPFDDKLRGVAADNVDHYWDDWDEYQNDRDGLIDDAVRSYLRSFFKKDFEMLTKMFASNNITEKTYNKKSLMKSMKADDGMIQLGTGEEYVIYAYGNGNDNNDDMWGDKTIFALDQDGEEHEIEYSDIVSYNESTVSEAKGFKNTTDFEKFLIEIDGMGESQIKKIMGKDYIDTPGYYQDEKGNYDDVEDFMRSNMGDSEFEELESWWENNVAESVVTEADFSFSSIVNEAKDLKVGDTGIDYNDNVVEIIAIGKYKQITKMFKKEMKADAEDYGYEKSTGDFYLTKNIEAPEGNVGDLAIYPVKYDMANYWGLTAESTINEDVDAKDIVKTIKAVSKQHNTMFANPFLMHQEPTHIHKELGPVKIHPGVPAYDWRRKGVIAVSTSLKGSKGWQFTGVDLKDLSELPRNFKLPKHWLTEGKLTWDSLIERLELDEATVVMDAIDPGSNVLRKLLKKHKVTMEIIDNDGPSGWPEVELTGDRKNLEKVLADENGWDDAGLAEYIEESNGTSTVKVKSLNEGRSINKISKDFGETVANMKKTVDEWKSAEGDRKTELLEKLRELNKMKAELEKELDRAVAGKDSSVELVLGESTDK